LKLIAFLLFGVLAVVNLTGCGQDRSALATKAVQTYWYDIGHAKVKQAYRMMTSGQRQVNDFSTYSQDMLSFLGATHGVSAATGKPEVSGDGSQAVVPVTLSATGSADKRHAYQHLFWENGQWRIADANGGLSLRK
jgi:hypothetical protein